LSVYISKSDVLLHCDFKCKKKGDEYDEVCISRPSFFLHEIQFGRILSVYISKSDVLLHCDFKCKKKGDEYGVLYQSWWEKKGGQLTTLQKRKLFVDGR
jgi:hypothetical protein